MNTYFNSKNSFDVNTSIVLPKGTQLFLEYENAKELILDEKNIYIWRLIIDDSTIFNPYRPDDLAAIKYGFKNPETYFNKPWPWEEFIKDKVLDTNSNKGILMRKHIKEVLKIEGFTGFYFMEGGMMGICLLDNLQAKVADRALHLSRLRFRDTKGFDPITGEKIMTKKSYEKSNNTD